MKNGLQYVVLSIVSVSVIITACQKELSCEWCETNLPPIANAGADQLINFPADSAILNGGNSTDPDGDIATWEWTKISGPAAQIVNTNDSNTIVRNLTVGTYLFALTVTDNDGSSANDSVQIIVVDPSSPNRPPVANAGQDQSVLSTQNTVTLDGSNSTDPDNNIVTYGWRKIEGPSSFSIANNTAVQTQVSNLVVGFYHFELTVTDAGGLVSRDTVIIGVVTPGGPCDLINRPVINAQLTPIGNLSFRKSFMKAAAANNKLVFAGGVYYIPDNTGIPTRRIDIYDIATNTWSIKDINDPPPYRSELGIAAVGNDIMIAGGGFWGDDIYTDRVDIYHTSNNTWSTTTLSEERGSLEGISHQNKAFFAGGFSFSNATWTNYWTTKVDIYDQVNNTWSTADLSEGRSNVSAVAAGNKVFFAGGEKNNGAWTPSDRIDIYDNISNSWTISSLQQPLVRLACISAGNKVFFAGGQSATEQSGHVEIRDINSGITTSACIIPRTNFSAVKKQNKLIFFTGLGSDPRNGTQFEIYDINSNIWYTGILNKKIQGASIICYNDIIYVAGGYVNDVGSDILWRLDF